MAKVSVIVPCYNLAGSVKRTIDSVLSQTLNDIELIVVNDGSTDDSEDVILKAIEGRPKSLVKYIRQKNSGVAHARNAGVAASTGKYIMCLDADDAIEPLYTELLSGVLDENREYAIVYTSLFYIKPNGETGLSKWPHEFDANKQIKGQNQIPTAAMMRREVWERLGGQRQRYAPLGAGAEDGEFWLRATAYGFNSLYVNPVENSFFVYSWMSGRVSGNKDYREVNYRAWHPWTKDEKYPLPCVAQPKQFSHPARWYDEPHVSVVIPVGPGHARMLVDALDSLDAQTYRYWEAVVVFDVPEEEWNQLKSDGTLSWLEKTWPFAKYTTTHIRKEAHDIVTKLEADKSGKPLLHYLDSKQYGASVARNVGVSIAVAPLILFLDADDWLLPEAIERMIGEYIDKDAAIYCDHYAIASIKQEDLDKVVGTVVDHSNKNDATLLHQHAADFDCAKAMQQPYTDGRVPYIWGSVVTLLPKRWITEVGGFDESLRSWEDVLLFWQLAWSGHCFFRIKEPLFVYRYTTGTRRDDGLANAKELLAYAKQSSEKWSKSVCNCKNDKPPISIRLSRGNESVLDGGSMTTLNLSRGGTINVADEDMVLCLYQPVNNGDMPRYGKYDFGSNNYIFYGNRSSGHRFLVHKLDIEADAKLSVARGHAPEFIPITQTSAAIKKQAEVGPIPPPPPAMIVEPEERETPSSVGLQLPSGTLKSIPVLDIDIGSVPFGWAGMLEENKIVTAYDALAYDLEHAERGGLTNIRGIGSKTRDKLISAIREIEVGEEEE